MTLSNALKLQCKTHRILASIFYCETAVMISLVVNYSSEAADVIDYLFLTQRTDENYSQMISKIALMRQSLRLNQIWNLEDAEGTTTCGSTSSSQSRVLDANKFNHRSQGKVSTKSKL